MNPERWMTLSAALLLTTQCGNQAAPASAGGNGAIAPPIVAATARPSETTEPIKPGSRATATGWIPFEGELVSRGDPSVVRDRYGRELHVPSSDVRIAQGKVELRVGARAGRPSLGGEIAAHPTNVTVTPATYEGECGGPAECVGLVRRCCGSGALVSFCFGMSDCLAAPTPATPATTPP